jgi:hypothetical protein|tara:strand:+ start:1939 stop:2229 length:291 start_codon:yes stop_codon:yes gene_type:complete
MTKLCSRGKAAAKRKFDVYPSAYANAYASKICAGKIKDPSGVKRKDFKGPKKAMGGMIDFNKISQDRKKVSSFKQGGIAKGCGAVMKNKRKKTKKS